MKPGEIHTWTLSPDTKGIVVEFNQNSLDQLIDHIAYTEDSLLIKKSQDNKLLHDTVNLMLTEFLAAQEFMDISLKGLLSSFLVQIMRLSGVKARPMHQTANLVDKFKELVEKNFKQEHRVEYYAKALGVTPKALTMQLSRMLGKAPDWLFRIGFLLEASVIWHLYSDIVFQKLVLRLVLKMRITLRDF